MEELNQGETSPITTANLGSGHINIPAKQKFIPKGALAFFVLLIVLCLIIWFGIYFLMLERS